MIIEISSGGGYAGLGGGGMTKRIDVSAQPEPVRQELCDAFGPDDLEALQSLSGDDGAADLTTYDITITDGDNDAHRYRIREDRLPPATLDLIDQM